MGTYPESFPEENIPDRVLAASLFLPACFRSGPMDSEHRRAMAYAAAMLSNYKTVHRRFQTWCRNEVLRQVLTDIANELRERGALDEEESFIDATFAMAKGGGAEIGPTKRGKGVKIMAIVDRHGLPLSVSTHAANHHEVRLVQLCFDFYMIEAKPENLVGDRAYDSDLLDEELCKDGIEMIAPHRSNRSKPPTQDGDGSADIRGAGSSNVSSPGYNGSGVSSSDGSTTSELPRLRPARLPHCPLQAILRWVLVILYSTPHFYRKA